MKVYDITIKPISGFGTPLKGDTLFGHVCWQAAYDETLFGKPIDRLLSDYSENPFLVVSTAFFKIGKKDNVSRIFKRPDMPLSQLFNFENKNPKDIIAERKTIKSKKWLKLEYPKRIDTLKGATYISESELTDALINEVVEKARRGGKSSLIVEFAQTHNTINRLTNTTGEGRFAPFTTEQMVFNEDVTLSIYVGLRDDILHEQIAEAFQRIGETGFGKDASTGLGKFNIISVDEINLADLGSKKPNACYTLSPCVPERDTFLDIYFTPFTRFGRHGDVLSKSSNPFKNPVLMADEGAVMIPKDLGVVLKRPYIGRAITGISKVIDSAIMQGYSLYIPVTVEV
ncbi:MAG: hypothetical protein N2745_11810 [Syntrophorhabdaceae bacterium]|nr:hypothetical protein [Syntrophorhabdaceae bacterium]